MINAFRILGYAPDLSNFLVSDLSYQTLSFTKLEREFVILSFAQAFSSSYEWDQHIPISDAIGVSQEQRDAIERGDVDSEAFTVPQRVLMRFARAVAQSPRASDELLAEFLTYYSHQQLIEILILSGVYFLIARITTQLDVELDEGAGVRLFRSDGGL